MRLASPRLAHIMRIDEVIMNYVARGPKKPVNMTLSEDLVREARLLTRNLSETVEQPACRIRRHRARQTGRERPPHRCDDRDAE